MRLATWNVNSIRTRIDRVLAFLERSNVDVLAMQETKCKPEQFPREPFEAAGYHLEVHGLNQWNGVAVASRLPILDVQVGFPGQPGWGDPEVVEARALGVTVEQPNGEPLTVWSLYIPNGRELDDPHFAYKLRWLEQLKESATSWLQVSPGAQIALVGDWNVLPLDEDAWDINYFEGRTHATPEERSGFSGMTEAGFIEVTRPLVTNYTYWDYQRLRFPRNEGMRIDFIFASPALAERVVAAEIDRDERKGKGASDHVPVIVEISS